MSAARAANDVVRFCLEVAALAALAVWGWRTGPTGVNVVLAIVAPLAAAILWGAFVAPKAPRHPRDPWRLLLEATVFLAGTVALAATGFGTAAAILGVASALHLVATFFLGQRGPQPESLRS